MIEIIPSVADNVVAFRLAGNIEARDFDLAIPQIEEKLRVSSKLRVYVEVDSFTGISPEALFKDIQFTLSHFWDFEKEAIVSSEDWLKNLAEFANFVLPHVEVKHFSLMNKDEALRWVMQ